MPSQPSPIRIGWGADLSRSRPFFIALAIVWIILLISGVVAGLSGGLDLCQ